MEALAKRPPRVLVVEDDAHFRGQLGDYFDYLGWERRLARDARGACAACSVYDPDLVLCDVMLPVINGFETVRQLRNLPTWRNVPVVFMSAQWRDPIGFEQRLRAAGAVEFLRKPLSIPDLGRRLALILDLDEGRRREARATRSGQFRNTSVDESLGGCSHVPGQGPISGLGVAELLLQLFDQERTGVVQLDQADATRGILVRDGLIVGVDSDRPPETGSAALLAAGGVDPGRIPGLLAAHRETGERIARLAVDRGLARREAIAPAIRHQALQVLRGAVRADGFYTFADGVDVASAGVLALHPIPVLHEALRDPPGLFEGFGGDAVLRPGPWVGESSGPRALPSTCVPLRAAAAEGWTTERTLAPDRPGRAPLLWMLMRLGAVVGDPVSAS